MSTLLTNRYVQAGLAFAALFGAVFAFQATSTSTESEAQTAEASTEADAAEVTENADAVEVSNTQTEATAETNTENTETNTENTEN